VARNRENSSSRNGRSPLAIAVAAGLLAGGIGGYGVAPAGPILIHVHATGKTTAVAGGPAQPAALMAYRIPAFAGSSRSLAGDGPSLPGRQLPATIGGVPADTSGKKPVTFSLFAGWGGAITWDPSNGEVTIAFGVGRQFSLSVNDLPSPGGASKDDGSFFKGAGIQGELGGKIPPSWADAVGLPFLAGTTLTGKANGKWSTDGTLTFRVIGQLRISPALVSKLPPELQPLFKDGSLALGYQWKVDTHGSPDARQWTIVSAETSAIGGQSYSFGSPGQAATSGREGMLATLGNSLFELFKSGTRDFGGHVAANFTVALGPRVKDAINSYMEHAFGDYSKQLNQDTKSLDKSNGLLQNELKSNPSTPQAQQGVKNLEKQLGAESGQLQTDTSQFQKNTAQGIQDLLQKLAQPPSPPRNPAPALPPAKENGPATGTAPSLAPPLGQNPAGAPPRPGGPTRPGDIPRGGTSTRPGQGFRGRASSRPDHSLQQPGIPGQFSGSGTVPGPVQGLPGTQSGPAATRPRPGRQPQPGGQPQPGSQGLPGTQSGAGVIPPQPGGQPQPGTRPQPGTVPQSGSRPQPATAPQARPGQGAQGGQGASSGAGQQGGIGAPMITPTGQQSGLGGSAGAVGGPGGQVASPASFAPAPAGTGSAPAPGQAPLPGSSGPQPNGGGSPPSDSPGSGDQAPQADSQSQPGAQSGGQVQGLPGTQSGPAATPPGSAAAPASGAQSDTNPDGTLNTPPLDRSEPDSTPFQSAPTQPATPTPDPAQPPVIVPPVVADAGGGIPDPTAPVIAVSAPAPPPQIQPVPVPVSDPTVDTADTSDDGIPAGDLGTPADLSGDTSGGITVADAGDGGDGGGDG
jgi:hypothetical protein